MSLLAPAALGLLSLSIPIVVLYMLRSRRQRVEVPSVRLWDDEEQYVSAALPWQRLRITAALLLQLLALAAFAFVLARPFFQERTLLGPHTVLVIDTSGSMALADRFDSAIREVRSLASEASEGRLISVIDAGPRPRVLAAFSRDQESVERAIDQLELSGGTEDLEGALRLARGLATPDRPTSILLMSDGGIAGGLTEPVTSTRHLLFDAVGDNVAITAFGTGVPGEGSSRVFVEVANFSAAVKRVSADLFVDGLAVGSVPFDLDPNGRGREIVTIDAGPGQVVEVRLAANDDANPLDDASALVLSGSANVSVTIAGEGSPFLDALIEALPGVNPAAGAPPDIVILDGGSATTVDRPAWLIAPEEPPPGLEVVGRVESPVITYQRPAEPLIEGIDFGDVAIAEADIVEGLGWLPLVRAGDVPLVLLGEIDGHRAVYFTFDVVRSNLPVQIGFPILGARIVDHLVGNRLTTSGTAIAGTPIPITPPPDGTTIVTLPGGAVVEVPTEVVEFADTGRPGVYTVEYRNAAGEVAGGSVAARQFVAAESAGGSRAIATTDSGQEALEESSVLREWAPLILALLLAIVLLEWWVAYGRPLPRRRSVLA